MAEQTHIRRNWLRWAGLAVIAVVAVAIYVSIDAQSNTANAACAAAPARAEALDEYAVGQVAAFRVVSDPMSMAEVGFETPDGEPRTFADFSGRLVLLNLWATWCAPCREEMPALEYLNTNLGGDAFQVLPVSLDTTNTPEGPQEFYEEIGLTGLELYVDRSARLLGELRLLGITPGLPTTILLDEEGCMLGILQGPANWGTQDAFALIEAAIADAP